ncbi:hypothetical protein AXF42_Ash002186 [Apostasia shenzhenica]|uniref:Uncharacterized protein n=1 Tax=Apostasia shenzhenica TaxID=1088818 RepID=A0A2I0AMV2_9ASPA|nr:hypothetical protein AXF42_Ash002186 [Apostasia shenzhenica]
MSFMILSMFCFLFHIVKFHMFIGKPMRLPTTLLSHLLVQISIGTKPCLSHQTFAQSF